MIEIIEGALVGMDQVHTGFRVCDFGPDQSDCDCCGHRFRQLAFRETVSETGEGEYFCLYCVGKDFEKAHLVSKS